MIEFEEEKSVQNWYVYDQFGSQLYSGPHFHTTFEFVYVFEGTVHINISKKNYDITEGKATLILPGQVHSYESTKVSNYYLCIFSPDYVPDFSIMTNRCELNSPIFDFPAATLIPSFTEKNCSIFLQKAFLYSICGLAAKGGINKSELPEDCNLIYKIIEYIGKNYKEIITLKEMANELAYNYTYLSDFFNKHFKVGFSKFINEYRVNHAKIMLRDTRLSMSQIANECGFVTIRNFNRVFLQTEKISPKKFREQVKDSTQGKYEIH